MTTSRTLRTSIAALAATASLGLVACGGSSSGGGGGATLDRAALKDRLSTICRDQREKADAIPKPTGTGDIAAYFAKAAPLAQDTVERLESITPAPDAKADFDKLLTAERAAATALEQAGGGGNAKALDALSDFGKQNEALSQAATSLGVSCR